MKKIYAILIAVFGFCFAQGQDLMSGDISFTNLSGYTYSLNSSIYSQSGSRTYFHLYFGGNDSVPVSLIDSGGNAYNYHVNANHTFPGTGVYTIYIEADYLIDSVNNFINASQESFYLDAQLVINPFASPDNSPVFTEPPIATAKTNTAFIYNSGADDNDGDSLSYALSSLGPGYSFAGASVDSANGTLSFTPSQAGKYLFKIKISMWRTINSSPVQIGYVTRIVLVEALQMPEAGIAFIGDTSGCTPLCLGFNDNSTGNPNSWRWTFTGGTPSSSTAQNPPGGICWNNPGIYSVTLVVSNGNGSDSVTLDNYFTVKRSPPIPTITQVNDTLFTSTDSSYIYYIWYDSTTIVSAGATDTIFIMKNSGNYSVMVVNSNCCIVATGHLLITGVSPSLRSDTTCPLLSVAIQKHEIEKSISISPNPASTQLTIHAPADMNDLRFSILNMLGQTMFLPRPLIQENGVATFDVGNLSAGIYFIEVINERHKWTGKFIKQ